MPRSWLDTPASRTAAPAARVAAAGRRSGRRPQAPHARGERPWPAAARDATAARALDAGLVHVVRVAVEVSGRVTTMAYPKSKAGRRSVPPPAFVVELLRAHRRNYSPGPAGEVFTNTAGGPLRRTLFRPRDWRPALVRAGLLGKVTQTGPHTYRAAWPDPAGRERSAEFARLHEAVTHVAKHAAGGLRFHDLRHSYATWLVSDRVPINDIVAVMGHENASTTLNLYTHRPDDRDQLIRDVFDDFSLTIDPSTVDRQTEEPSVEGS